jgi:hypothetical protein
MRHVKRYGRKGVKMPEEKRGNIPRPGFPEPMFALRHSAAKPFTAKVNWKCDAARDLAHCPVVPEGGYRTRPQDFSSTAVRAVSYSSGHANANRPRPVVALAARSRRGHLGVP